MAIIPSITILNSPTGTIPFTVFVSAQDSNFDGVNPHDCLFNWTFGDNNPPTNGPDNYVYTVNNFKNKTRLLDPRVDNNADNTNNYIRTANTNSDQKGIAAAYTYYHASGFTISLNIIHGGTGSVTTTTGITTSNTGIGWTLRTVDTFPFGGGANHASLEDAFTWITANQPNGRVQLRFNTVFNTLNFAYFNRSLTIPCSNLQIVTNTGNNYPVIFLASSSYNKTNITPFLLVPTGVKDLYIENASFGADADQAGDPVGSGQGNRTTSRLNGINVSGCASVTLHECRFRNLNQSINITPAASSVYISDAWSWPTNIRTCNLHGTDIIINGLAIRGIDNAYTSASTNTSGEAAMHLGQLSPIKRFALNWCEVLNNAGLVNTNGFVKIHSATSGIISNNTLLSGNIYITSGYSIRVDSNRMSAGGPNPTIRFMGNSSGINVINNILTINSCPATTSAMKFSTGTITDINFINNTWFIDDTVNNNEALFDLRANGGTLARLNFSNNLITANTIFYVSRYFLTDSNPSGYLTCNSNTFPIMDESIPFIKIGGTDNSWNWWVASGVASGLDLKPGREDIIPTDLRSVWRYILPTNIYPTLSSGITSYNLVNRDYNNVSRASGNTNWGRGATASTGLLIPVVSGSFTVIAASSIRTRPSGATAYNFYTSILDPSRLVPDITGNLTSKTILGVVNGIVSGQYSLLLNNVGDWIKTVFGYTTNSSGIDIDITYLNDGPPSQTSGDARQNLGDITTDGFLIGRRSILLHAIHGSTPIEIDVIGQNYTGPSLTYPIDYFSPASIYISNEYATTVFSQFDFYGNNRSVSIINRANTQFGRPFSSIWDWEALNNNRDCLNPGESLSFRLSIRISRDPKNWVQTLSDYKTYFINTYGGPSYIKDPRPIIQLNGVRDAATPLGYSASYNPTVSGFAAFADVIRNEYTIYNYERVLVWGFAGLYNVSTTFNYPFLMTSPLLNNLPPHSTYPPVGQTKSLLRDALWQVPVGGLYHGYASAIHTEWDPTGNIFIDTNNAAHLQYTYNEYDPAIDYFKVNWIGMDAYNAGFFGITTLGYKNYIDILKSRYPNVRFLTELSSSDYLVNRGPNYLFQENGTDKIDGPHILADFLIPGQEHLVAVNPVTTMIPRMGSFTTGQVQSAFRAVARWGWVVSSTELPTPVGSSIFNSVDRRFDHVTAPADFPTISPPSNLNYTSLTYVRDNEQYGLKSINILLTWSPNTEPDLSHYKIYKTPVVSGISRTDLAFQVKDYVRTNSYRDTAIESGHIYNYKVTAVDLFGNESEFSSLTSVTYSLRQDFISKAGSLFRIGGGYRRY